MDELALRQINDGDDEEAAFRRAMALSIRDAESARTGRTDRAVIGAGQAPAYKRSASTATTESEASSTSSASALPGPAGVAASASNEKQVLPSDSLASAPAAPAPSAMSLLALDRKAMEAERLARRQRQLDAQKAASKGGGAAHDQQHQKQQELTTNKPTKRKADGDIIVIDDDDDNDKGADATIRGAGQDTASTSGHFAPPSARRRKIDDHGSKPEHIVLNRTANMDKGKDASRGRTLSSWSPPASASASTPVSTPTSTPTSAALTPPSSSLPYAKGVVKKTWARGQPRRGDDITIDEIWQKDQLELAILSSFQWDDEWMMSHLNLAKTRLLLIAFAADDQQKEEMTANVPSDRIRFCFPRMQTMGHMHSKLQLLKFPKFLRIVVPTGNLTPYDWGETGTIENMAFIIDLPRLPKEERANAVSTAFQEDMCYFLKAQGVEDAMINSIRNFDYSETARYAFVHTISGSYTDAAWERTGYAGLGRAVKALGWDTEKPIQIDYICSSIGSLSDDLTTALYHACQGDSGMKEFESRASRSRKPKAKGQSQLAPTPQSSAKDCLRLYFPSQETVTRSLGGVNGAGTVCFQRKWWEAPTFPREIFRDGQNVRKGVLLHSKLMLVRRPEDTTTSDGQSKSRCRGWAYVGSANMSESAWGRIVKDRATGKIKMSCRSWECGVLIPVLSDESLSTSSSSSSSTEDAYMLDTFRGTLPVPISVPASRYGAGKQPWFFLEGTN